jgi:hypothetical protein
MQRNLVLLELSMTLLSGEWKDCTGDATNYKLRLLQTGISKVYSFNRI